MASISAPVTTAVVVAGEEESRVLLRGLLRLHHYRVLGEADSVPTARELIQQQAPGIVVVDVNLSEGTPADVIKEARVHSPECRVVLVGPSSRPPAFADGLDRPDVVLLRPFRIQQFTDALSGRAA